MRPFLTTHLLFSCVVGLGLILFLSTQSAGSFLLGSFVFVGNFVLMAISWSLIFKKKFIALAIALIVLKYAILGLSVYWSMHSSWINAKWFVGGVASFTLSAMVTVLKERKNVV